MSMRYFFSSPYEEYCTLSINNRSGLHYYSQEKIRKVSFIIITEFRAKGIFLFNSNSLTLQMPNLRLRDIKKYLVTDLNRTQISNYKTGILLPLQPASNFHWKTNDTHNTSDVSQWHYAKWKKSTSKDHTLYDCTYIMF